MSDERMERIRELVRAGDLEALRRETRTLDEAIQEEKCPACREMLLAQRDRS